ncbi:MAG: prepilin-type N-terminal cleavage/methylation domain-containing protein [Proteobacteria bacterium]|nr:prepilin-type N-terminal cleavage/methylation domain-containing protein [Pseudomonadota bacterium]
MKSYYVLKRTGFTLLELLVTLALFSAIMSLLLSSFFQFQNQTKRVDAIFQLRQEARILEKLLREDLQTAVYFQEFARKSLNAVERKSGIVGIDDVLNDKDGDKIYMHVNRPSLFLRTLSIDIDPEIHEVGYYLEEADDGVVRFKRREEFYIDSDITDGEENIVHTLSENVTAFNVKYYKGTESEALVEWDSSKVEDIGKKQLNIPSGMEISMELTSSRGEKLLSRFEINLHPDMGSSVIWK